MLELYDDLVAYILEYLESKDLAHLSTTCKRLQGLCKADKLWKELYAKDFVRNPQRFPKKKSLKVKKLDIKTRLTLMNKKLSVKTETATICTSTMSTAPLYESTQTLKPWRHCYFQAFTDPYMQRGDGITGSFQREYSLDQRKRLSQEMIKHLPDCIPVVIEKQPSVLETVLCLENKSYSKRWIVSGGMKLSSFTSVVRKENCMKKREHEFLVNGCVKPPKDELIAVLHARYHCDDGFLYLSSANSIKKSLKIFSSTDKFPMLCLFVMLFLLFVFHFLKL